jgi:cytochrome P450
MALKQELRRRVLEPAVMRILQWRGDPLARLLGAGATSDPYPIYDTLRQHPLRRSPLGVWATASHATASSILRDQRFSSSPRHQPGYQPPSYPPGDARRDHTRIRRLVSGAFTPRRICELEHFIRETTDWLLTKVGAPEGFDLIEAVAFPLPIAVICHLLGVPTQDQARFRIWGHDLATTLEPQINPNAESRSRASQPALTAYLRALVERDAPIPTTVWGLPTPGVLPRHPPLPGRGTRPHGRAPRLRGTHGRRYPRLTLSGPPTRRPLLVFRGFEHVSVRV